MGWYGTYGSYSADSIKREFMGLDSEGRLREDCYGEGRYVTDAGWAGRGVLWGVLRERDGTPLSIICWLVERHADKDSGGYGRGRGSSREAYGEWLYKPLDEGCGPVEVSCPLRLLELVPCPGGYAISWRERVRDYWAARGEKLKGARREVVVGATRQGLHAGGVSVGGQSGKVTRERGKGYGSISVWIDGVGSCRVKPGHIASVGGAEDGNV